MIAGIPWIQSALNFYSNGTVKRNSNKRHRQMDKYTVSRYASPGFKSSSQKLLIWKKTHNIPRRLKMFFLECYFKVGLEEVFPTQSKPLLIGHFLALYFTQLSGMISGLRRYINLVRLLGLLEPWRRKRNFVSKRLYWTTILRCVKSQNSAHFIFDHHKLARIVLSSKLKTTYERPSLPCRKYSWYALLLEAESTAGS